LFDAECDATVLKPGSNPATALGRLAQRESARRGLGLSRQGCFISGKRIAAELVVCTMLLACHAACV